MAWVQDPKVPEKDPFVERLLSLVHNRINQVMKQYPNRGLIDALARIYWKSWWSIKPLSGTSAQWPWLAEYSVFYVVKQHFEKILNEKFNPMKGTKYLWRFVIDSNNMKYTLSHNYFLETKEGMERKIQPDVFLLKNDNLVFTMDVKVALSDSASLCNALDKLSLTAETYSSQPYLVSVAQNLTFSASAGVKKSMKRFHSLGGMIVGPKDGTLDQKMKELSYHLSSLEECFVKIDAVL